MAGRGERDEGGKWGDDTEMRGGGGWINVICCRYES